MPVRAWKARKRLQSVSGGQARRYPSQGLSGRQEPRQPPAKPICTVQAATRLVGGRRPSVLQRWGSGVFPRRFPVALKALPEPWRLGRSGDRGAKHARDFEAAKEQCRIDNPLEIACNVLWIVRLPLAL